MTFRERVGFGLGTGAAGFVLGTANNIFGDTGSSGDTDLSTITIAADRATAESTRDAYDTATMGWLANYQDIDVNIILYYTAATNPTIQYQRRIGINWVDNGPAITAVTGPQGPTGPAGAGVDFTGFQDGDLLMYDQTGNTTTPSALRQNPATDLIEADNKIIFNPTVNIGAVELLATANILRLRGGGGTFIPLGSAITSAGTGNPLCPTLGAFGDLPSAIQQPDTSETQTVTPGMSMSYTQVIPAGVAHVVTQIDVTSTTVGEIRIQIFSDVSLSADSQLLDERATLTIGTTTIDYDGWAFYEAGETVYIRYTNVGTADITLNGLTIASQFIPTNTLRGHPYSVDTLESKLTDLSGVIVQDEGTPLATRGTTLNFVGTGVAATGTGDTKTITITAGGGGISGVTIQDEGTPLTTAATTLNFVGAGVTAVGTTDTKTITIPAAQLTIQEEGVSLTNPATTLNFLGTGITAAGTGSTKTITVSGLTVQDEGTPLTSVATALNFTGAGVTATGTGATKTINIPGTPAGQAVTSLHNFSISIPSRVDIGTNLNVQQTVSFDVSNFSNLTALTLVVTDGDDITLTTPIRDGVQSQTVTLAGTNTGAATTITFQLSGTVPTGTVTSNIQTVTVANAQAQEQAYYGGRLTNDFATADVAQLTGADVTNAGSVYEITETVPNGSFFGILSPTNRDPVSVINTVLNINELASFTATTNVRTIGGLSYNLLSVQNNSGFQSVFRYRVTTE